MRQSGLSYNKINERENINVFSASYFFITSHKVTVGGEQPLPQNGCCDLGPIILTKLVKNPFTDQAEFDFEKLKEIVKVQVRFLDNVLDATLWPLEEQREESSKKRRIGIGFTGLANTLAMMNKLYFEPSGLELAELIAKTMRDTAYDESINLAIEKGSFPLFSVDKYLEEGTFASRLPENIKNRIREHGIRNSHLLSIAPVGTVSLAFADNASNGIEPPFSLAYTRKKRTNTGHQIYNVLDHSFRVWVNMVPDKEFAKVIEEAVCSYKTEFEYKDKTYIIKDILPSSIVTALEMSTDQHLLMMKTVQPYIDTSISKCVAKGTPIITNKGILPIEALGYAKTEEEFDKPLDELKVLCPDGNWRNVTAHYYGGKKAVISIYLSNGQVITASHTHKLMDINDNWVSMPDFKIGDLIKVKRNVDIEYTGGLPLDSIDFKKQGNDYKVPEHMSPDLALFLGMMAADGHLQIETGCVCITKNNGYVGELFKRLSREIFGVTKIKHIIDPRNNVNSWYFTSRSIVRWLTGIIGYRALDKHIPYEIMFGSKQEMKMFLSGLSLDGYKAVGKYDNDTTYIYFGKSISLAKQSFSLLKILGYQPRIQNKYVKDYDYYIHGVSAQGINFCIEERKNTENNISDEYIRLPDNFKESKIYSNESGYSQVRKLRQENRNYTSEKSFNKNFNNEYDKNFIYYKITKIKYGIDDIYDIEVEDSHDYLIDGVVSHNTVNVPKDYPFEDFKAIYEKAWNYKLKGISTYRPNEIIGSVLSVEQPKETEVKPVVQENKQDTDNGKSVQDIVKEMYSEQFESRKDGELSGVSIKGRFHTNQGEQKFILTINFIEIQRQSQYGIIAVKRPVEFLLTSNFTSNSSVWDTSMRFMSLMGRSGVPMNKIIENLKEVTWEHGPVRYGTFSKNGKDVPLWHNSDTAVIGYVIEQLLKKEGLLDNEGLPIYKYTTLNNTYDSLQTNSIVTNVKVESGYVFTDKPIGKKCLQCGAYAVIKKDGCEQCQSCGEVGSCG